MNFGFLVKNSHEPSYSTSNWNLALMRAINNMIRLREFSLEYNPMLNLEAETADDEAKSFKTLTPAMKVVILKDLVDRQLVHAQAVHEFVDERCRNRKKEVEIETLVSAFAFDKDGHSIYKIPGEGALPVHLFLSHFPWLIFPSTLIFPP